jgi:hypothetical protein
MKYSKYWIERINVYKPLPRCCSPVDLADIDQSLYPKHIDQLKVSNAKASVLFLVASGMWYDNRTIDPWFSATTPKHLQTDRANYTVFVPDEPAAPLGCVSSRQYCKPGLSRETGCINTADEGFKRSMDSVWTSKETQAYLLPIFSTTGYGMLADYLGYYQYSGVPNILATAWAQLDGQPVYLPEDHWKREIEYVFRATLAGLQATMVDFANGYWTSYSDWCKNGLCQRLCDSQVQATSPTYMTQAATNQHRE